MKRFVIDANVAIKWVLPEIHSETAWKLLEPEYDGLVPDFFFLEAIALKASVLQFFNFFRCKRVFACTQSIQPGLSGLNPVFER